MMRPGWIFLVICLAFTANAQETERLPANLQVFFDRMAVAQLASEQVLKFNNGTEPKTLDPAIMTGSPEINLARALFEGLVTENPRTLDPCPGMAKKWEISADGLVYTFHLRKNSRWSNQQPVTAYDFLRSWERVLNPNTAAEYAYQLYYIKNGRAYNKGEIPAGLESFRKHVGVRAPDRWTLIVTLESPTPYFLHLCAFPTLYPVPIDIVNKYGDRWTFPEHIVCNGPFMLKQWKAREYIVMVPNPYHWMRKYIKLQKIMAYSTEDLNTAYNKYLNRELDWLMAVPSARINEIKKNPDFKVAPYIGVYFYRFNITAPPFDDVRVRVAFSMAIDREHLCQFILKSGETPAYTHVPPGMHYQGPEGLGYNPEVARQMLADAGYPDGRGFPPVNLFFNTSESHKLLAEKITQMWRRVLRVTVGLENSEWKVFLERTRRLDYQISRGGWIGDYLDPNTFLDMFVTGGGNNRTGFSNAEYDEMIAKAQKELDPVKRNRYFYRAEEILCEEELPIIPIYFYVNKSVLRPTIKGVYGNLLDNHPFQYIYLVKD